MQQNTTNNNQTESEMELHPELNRMYAKKPPINKNTGKIQEILKNNPEIEERRRANQLQAISRQNQRAYAQRIYNEYAEATDFTQKWLKSITDANITDPSVIQAVGEELLRQHITTIGIAGYYEAKNGWVPDNQLLKERMALIKLLQSNVPLPKAPWLRKSRNRPCQVPLF
jgi:hypothetical protein